MSHKTPKPDAPDTPPPLRETPNRDPQRKEPAEGDVDGHGHKQPAPTDISDPRDVERGPPGPMDFPGPNPDEPAKQLSGGPSARAQRRPGPVPDHGRAQPSAPLNEPDGYLRRRVPFTIGTSERASMDDIITALKDDHVSHRALLARLEATSNRSVELRARWLAELDLGLRLHMRFEEEVLFPALRPQASVDTRAQTLEAYAEHEAARATLYELESVDNDTDLWGAWLRVLREELEHHMQEEEDDLFPQARQLIDADTRHAMAQELRRWKTDARALRDDGAVTSLHHTPLVGMH